MSASELHNYISLISQHCYAPAPRVGALSDDARLTSDVSLSHSSGLSREQRGLGRLKLVQR